MPLLNARGLSKAYGPQMILDEANLVIQPGERIGLVGVNGSGKSTLARILAGLDTPDTGDVVLQRDITVSYLSQQPELEPGKQVMEVVLGGLQRWTAAKQRFDAASEELDQSSDQADPARLDQLVAEQSTAAAEVERLGGWDVSFRARSILDNLRVSRVDSPADQLSGGEQRRVALARILVGQPHIALLDEPTNHLDLATIEWLETYLRDQFSGALLLITHDRTLIDCVAQRTLELERGVLRSYDGGYVAFLEAKAERLSQEARAEANRQRFVRRELQWLRRQPKARTGKQKARIQRAQNAMAVDAPAAAKELHLRIAAPRSSKRVLLLEELTLQLGDKRLVSDLDLLVTRGERIGVLGPNGCGKTTLLRAITGQLEPVQGRVWRSGNAAIAYLSQQRDDLDDNASVIEAVADGQRKVTVGERAVDVEAYLARFLFPSGRTDQPVRSLSGGERTRVALARMLCRPANLVILDEPTNDLDVPTIAAVEQLIVEQTTTAIVVTHDRWFLDRVATSLLVFEGQGQVVRYEGNYSMYQRLVATKAEGRPTAAISAKAAPTPKRASGLTYGEKIELEGLLDKVAEAEERVTQLEAQLTDPAIYGDHNRVTALSNEIAEARGSAAALLARWEELESKRDQS